MHPRTIMVYGKLQAAEVLHTLPQSTLVLGAGEINKLNTELWASLAKEQVTILPSYCPARLLLSGHAGSGGITYLCFWKKLDLAQGLVRLGTLHKKAGNTH